MVAGYSYASFGQSDVMLAKLTSEGSLDTGFGTNGIVLTSIGAGLDLGYAVSIQPDGRMVVCGSSADANGVVNGLVLRFNEDGALDNSFSGDGYAVITAWQAEGLVFHRGEHRHRVVIGKDTRLSGYMIETAMVAGFMFSSFMDGLFILVD